MDCKYTWSPIVVAMINLQRPSLMISTDWFKYAAVLLQAADCTAQGSTVWLPKHLQNSGRQWCFSYEERSPSELDNTSGDMDVENKKASTHLALDTWAEAFDLATRVVHGSSLVPRSPPFFVLYNTRKSAKNREGLGTPITWMTSGGCDVDIWGEGSMFK